MVGEGAMGKNRGLTPCTSIRLERLMMNIQKSADDNNENLEILIILALFSNVRYLTYSIDLKAPRSYGS
jgi:hypothetical protein